MGWGSFRVATRRGSRTAGSGQSPPLKEYSASGRFFQNHHFLSSVLHGAQPMADSEKEKRNTDQA
jgi:hypothetical protein